MDLSEKPVYNRNISDGLPVYVYASGLEFTAYSF